jgi:hypothetical protein
MADFLRWLGTLLGFCDPDFGRAFWPNFWSNLFSGAIVATFVVWLVSRLTAITKRPNITVKATISRHPRALGNNAVLLDFYIGNSGNIAVNSGEANEIYWEVFVPSGLVERTPQMQNLPTRRIQNRPFDILQGSLGKPLFPGRSLHILEQAAHRAPKDQYEIYFRISSFYGVFPQRMSRTKRLWEWIRTRGHFDAALAELGRVQVIAN